MGELKLKSAEELYRAIEPDLRWLDIPYGNVLLFTQNVMHGNIVNREAGDPVVDQLPLQERVLARITTRSSASSSSRSWFGRRPASAPSYRLPSVA